MREGMQRGARVQMGRRRGRRCARHPDVSLHDVDRAASRVVHLSGDGELEYRVNTADQWVDLDNHECWIRYPGSRARKYRRRRGGVHSILLP